MHKIYPKIFILLFVLLAFGAKAQQDTISNEGQQQQKLYDPDNLGRELLFPLKDNSKGSFFLEDPEGIDSDSEYDPEREEYVKQRKVGDTYLEPMQVMTRKQYSDDKLSNDWAEYFKQRKDAFDEKKPKNPDNESIIPKFRIQNNTFESIFEGEEIDIKPSGTFGVEMGVKYQYLDNPMLSQENRGFSNLDYNQTISLSVDGKIGKALSFKVNYDTKAMFSFQNMMNISFTPSEDKIVQKLEVGNISYSSPNSLIRGGQSLFGAKGEFKFGNTYITAFYSEQKSDSKTVVAQPDGAVAEIEFYIDKYEENRHYFLSQFFRDKYDESLLNYPFISSGVQILRLEVWVTNKQYRNEGSRSLVAFTDLGEYNPSNSSVISYAGQTGLFPQTEINSLRDVLKTPSFRELDTYQSAIPGGFRTGYDYILLENAQMLTESDYELHPQLGYISLNKALNDNEVLSVAFQYSYRGKVYQVGNFSTDEYKAPKVLGVKLIKSNLNTINSPLWDLMMKNVYSLGATNISSENFKLQLLYYNDNLGKAMSFLDDAENPHRNKQILNLFGWDRLNQIQNISEDGDGVFDFVDKVTINSRTGRVYFTKVEPFGSYIHKIFAGQSSLIEKYAYDDLYKKSKFQAESNATKNKFLIKAKFKGNASDEGAGGGISLDAVNVARGSVTVMAGSQKLVEGMDYIVDYQLGKVKIINDDVINSGQSVSVNLENNDSFSAITKQYGGISIDQKINRNMNAGVTFVGLGERPMMRNSNYGAEPVSNMMLGGYFNYQKEVDFLTKIANIITPWRRLTTVSKVQFLTEIASLFPGQAAGNDIAGEPASYLDDFEQSRSSYDMKTANMWKIASTPQLVPDIIPPGVENTSNPLAFNYKRALLSWYSVDQMFYNSSSRTPSYFKSDKSYISNDYERRIFINEIFPNKEITPGSINYINTLDLAYYPSERGSYNFDFNNINPDGTLEGTASSNWAGIMRHIPTSNFEEANIGFLEFWIMDPYGQDYKTKGEEGARLIFNIGSVSEDILKDGRKSYESGISVKLEDIENMKETDWAKVPTQQNTVNSFSSNLSEKTAQDVGLNGLNDDEERAKFLKDIEKYTPGTPVYNDPAADNFHYFRATSFDDQKATISQRYKKINGTQGNSTGSTQAPEDYPTYITNEPDKEDLNNDQTLSTDESYYQYEVKLNPSDLSIVGKNHITDIRKVVVERADGTRSLVNWIQFKIPIFSPERKVGEINDFRAMRFIRMYITEAKKPLVVRFAELKFVRSEWRVYNQDLRENSLGQDITSSSTIFDVNVVSLEQNSNKQPVPYALPPGIERQQLFNGNSNQAQNEQSLLISATNLAPQDIRAVYKKTKYDMRNYGKLKMFVHLEAMDNEASVSYGDIDAFLRLGQDYDLNYYQYTKSLEPTPWGVSQSQKEQIWKPANDFEVPLEAFAKLKIDRDKAVSSGAHPSINVPYYQKVDNVTLSIKGQPNLADVRAVMLGMQNNSTRDKNVELWFDELRFTSMDESASWAINSQLNFNLSDLADFSLAGSYSSAGFGALDQKVSERSLYDMFRYNVTTKVNLGHFFPQNWGVRLPFYVSHNQMIENPIYNPLNPDVKFSQSVSSIEDKSERDNLKNIARENASSTSISFLNVGKEKVGEGKTKIYSPENFSVSYSFVQQNESGIDVEYFRSVNHKASIDYNFNGTPVFVTPFKENEKFAGPNYKIIKDFNFSYMPSRLLLRVYTDRFFSQELPRDINPLAEDAKLKPIYNKDLKLGYDIGFTFPFSRALKLDFLASVKKYIPETDGPIDNDAIRDIKQHLSSFGLHDNYHHRIELNYNIPINKLPYMEWFTASASYATEYDWRNPSMAYQNIILEDGSSADLGNTIANSNQFNARARFDFAKFYGMFNKKKGASSSSSGGKSSLDRLRANNNTANSGPVLIQGAALENRNSESSFGNNGAGQFLYNFVTMIKDVSANYTYSNTLSLSGFMPDPGVLALGTGGSKYAPGLDFVLGFNENILYDAFLNGWLTKNADLITDNYTQGYNNKFQISATIEPIKKLSIQLDASFDNYLMKSSLYSVDYDVNSPSYGVQVLNPRRIGNYTRTISMLATSFDKNDANFSQTIQTLKANRYTIASRLAQKYKITETDASGYPKGILEDNPEVLAYSFISAYTGTNPEKQSLNMMGGIPIPNFSIKYTGLSDIPFLKRAFNSVGLSSRYLSSFSVNNFESNLNFGADFEDGFNMQMPYIYSGVNMVERFDPFIKLDVSTKNNISFNAQYKRDRMLTLDLSSNNISERLGNEVGAGIGYTLKDLSFVIQTKYRRDKIKSDLNFKVDVAYRSNFVAIRSLSNEPNVVSGGEDYFIFKFSVEYNFIKQLQSALYFETASRKYQISTAYPSFMTRGGISLKYNLGN